MTTNTAITSETVAETMSALSAMTKADLLRTLQMSGSAITNSQAKKMTKADLLKLAEMSFQQYAETTETTENKEEDTMTTTTETATVVAETTETETETTVETKTTETEPKAEKKARTKKTYEKLIMDLPTIVQTRCVCERSKKGVAIHVKLGKRRVFAYDGVVIIVNRDTLLDHVEAEKRNYGYRVAPTRENMLQLLHNAGVC